MTFYPSILLPFTAKEAYSYLPGGHNFYLATKISAARSRSVLYARHALLELRDAETAKRRQFYNGKYIIPLTNPTNDEAHLNDRLRIGRAIADRVNGWIEDDWRKTLGFEVLEVVKLTNESHAYQAGLLCREARTWLERNVGMKNYGMRGHEFAFRRSGDAARFKLVWSE